MQRIFLSLSILALLLLAVNALLGFASGDFNGAFREAYEAGRKLDSEEKRYNATAAEKEQARGEWSKSFEKYAPFRSFMEWHVLLGCAAALTTILVNSIAVTYFVGTTRWCKEVVETYKLDPNWIEESFGLKRRSFAWSLGGILVILGVVGLGAAADPRGMNIMQANSWVQPHFFAALASMAFIAWAFYRQYDYISSHHVVIERIMAEVRRVREQRGLETE